MRFVATVGTTGFDGLIRKIDELASKHPEHEFLSQIGPGLYHPVNHPWVSWEKDFLSRRTNSVVITHCGAGTVYYLLETAIPFIAVPNLQRVDPHQIELAQYLHQHSYALVCFSVTDLDNLFSKRAWEHFQPSVYVKDKFFRGLELRAKIEKW